MPEPTSQLLAVFIDFENLALGFRDKPDRFRISRVIARLVEKGHIVVKRAYADWKRFASYTHPLHEHAIELIEIPTRGLTGKNSADMRLCVDVMDLCYSKPHIDTFVILSGDSDFSPLVSKLKENGKRVIGLGVKQSTSDLLRDNCDEFIYYEDLEAEQRDDVPVDLLSGLGKKEGEVYSLLLDSLKALRRQNRDVYWASLIKETMQRKMPSFSESYYGFKSFGELLQSAAKRGLVELARDSARRTHVVTTFGDDVGRDKKGASEGRSSLRSSRSGRGRGGSLGGARQGSSNTDSSHRASGRSDDGDEIRYADDDVRPSRSRSNSAGRRGGPAEEVDADQHAEPRPSRARSRSPRERSGGRDADAARESNSVHEPDAPREGSPKHDSSARRETVAPNEPDVAREPRAPRVPRAPRESRESGAAREPRATRAPRESGAAREPRATRAPREPIVTSEPSNPARAVADDGAAEAESSNPARAVATRTPSRRRVRKTATTKDEASADSAPADSAPADESPTEE